MWDYDLLRGKVTAHLRDKEKGLVEVAVGGYNKDRDKIHARVEPPFAGVYWLPEIGDVVEVLVPKAPGYEAQVLQIHRSEGNGQIAACWTENNDKKQVKTRSGHCITLDDTQDKTSIMVQSAGGVQLCVNDETQTVTVKGRDNQTPKLTLDLKEDTICMDAGQKFTITCGGASIELDSNGNVKIQTGGKLELSGQQITLNAKSKLSASGQQVEMSGSMSTKVTAQTQLEVSSSGITEVKGNMVKLN